MVRNESNKQRQRYEATTQQKCKINFKKQNKRISNPIRQIYCIKEKLKIGMQLDYIVIAKSPLYRKENQNKYLWINQITTNDYNCNNNNYNCK